VFAGFSFKRVDEVEVFNSIMGIKSTAVCADVHQNFSMPNFVRSHASVFITSFSYPSIWKTVVVLPPPKISSSSVFILPDLSKGVERFLYDQLVAYLESNGILSQFQSGSNRCHRTASALVKIMDDIQVGVEASGGFYFRILEGI
jgi:hypothetical protein